MCSWPGSPFDLEDKAPEPPGGLILEDLQTLHIPNKQETRCLDTRQATSFFPWWLRLFFQENTETKGVLYKILKSGKNPVKSQSESEIFSKKTISKACLFHEIDT